jgi:hypothetical protein
VPAGYITPSDTRLRMYVIADFHPFVYTVWLKAEKDATCSDSQNIKEIW